MDAKTIDLNDADIENLISEIRNNLNTQLDAIFDAFYEHTDSALFELGSEATSNTEQKQFFELLHAFRTNKAALVSGLRKQFTTYLQPLSEKSPDYDFEVDDDEMELSLVSQDTMEEMVLINSINTKTVDMFSESIGKLERRFEFLAEKSSSMFEKDALAPMNFCMGFKDSIAILDITTADKLILYKLFDNEVTSQLNELYDQLNKLMIEAGILPKLKLHQFTQTAGSSANNAAEYYEEADDDVVGDAEAVSNEVSSGGPSQQSGGSQGGVSQGGVSQGGVSQRGRNSTGNIDDASVPEHAPASAYMTAETATNHSAIQGASSAPAMAGDGNSATGDTENQPTGRKIGAYPVDKINQVIRDYIGNPDPAAGSVEGSAQFYGHQDVLAALTSMQAEAVSQVIQETPVVEKIDAAAIKQALVSTIADQQGGTITKQVDKVIEKTIDFIKLIFDAIIEDENISDTIKTILLRLQIPVIKASMLDQEFFIDDEHPARQLLDKIAELGVGVTSHEDQVYQQIDEVIRTLLEEYVDDINAFVTALEKIQAIINQRAEEAEEKERRAQQEVQKVHARKIVLSELRKSTYGKKLPSPVHKLVLKLWPTLMYNHYLRFGKENDEWINQVTIMRELIDSLQPPANDEAYDNLQKNYLPISIRIEKQLNKCKIIRNHKADAIQALKDTYQNLLDDYVPVEQPELPAANETPANKEELTPAPDDVAENGASQSSIEPEVRTDDFIDEIVDQKDKLKLLPLDVRPGVWFQLMMENGRTRRLKLSIIVIDEAMLVFVDHDGNRVIEKVADEFAEDLIHGRASLIMSHSVFDHALTSAFESIQ